MAKTVAGSIAETFTAVRALWIIHPCRKYSNETTLHPMMSATLHTRCAFQKYDSLARKLYVSALPPSTKTILITSSQWIFLTPLQYTIQVVTQRKIFILLGHSHRGGFTAELASVYESAAREAGHEVRRLNIDELQFDPILHKGYSEIQPLEPDLIRVQENIRWADHIVILYPNWWTSMPAILKGMFDRMWLPGFAFKFDHATHEVEGLLQGKTARVIVVDGAHSPFMTRLKYGDYTNEISRGILGFSGIKTHVTTMGPCEHTDPSRHSAWIEDVRALGTKGD